MAFPIKPTGTTPIQVRDTVSNISPAIIGETPFSKIAIPSDTTHTPSTIFTAKQGLSPTQRFVQEIILPLVGSLNSVRIEYGIEAESNTQTLTVSNSVEIEGKPYEPVYIFKFSNDAKKVECPQISSLKEPNVVVLPINNWNQDEFENAWRKVTIANEGLYPRFVRKEIKPEKYQLEALAEMRQSIQTNGSALVVMGTGLGKTPVAFWSNDELLQDLRKVEPGKGVVLFIVNNKTILDEAQEKLVGDGKKNKGLFGDKYKVSRIYEGTYDPSGDFIFCTVSSLMSQNRAHKLIHELKAQGRRIEGIVVDEVHHLPAEQTRLLFYTLEEASINNKWNTVPYGFTATDIRPDRKSLLPFFGGEITYEFSIVDGWNSGHLTPIQYLKGYSHIKPYLKDGILDISSLPCSKFDLYYGNNRFPDILELYKKCVASNPYSRVLIAGPTIERIEALADYFRENKVNAIALHSKVDQRVLDDNYHAIKHGEWPEHSDFCDKPVPQCIMAVDLFREGTDACGINTLIIWDDTDSIIRFMQTVGRGVRPFPGKTHLTVYDLVGLIEKVHLMNYLGGMFISSGKEGLVPAGPKKGTKDIDTDEVPGTEHLSQVLGGGIQFDEDVSNVLRNRFSDTPEQLLLRYASYPNVPPKENAKLDRFIAVSCGFPDEPELKEFKAYLYELAIKLATPDLLTDKDYKDFRSRFVPIFYSDTDNESRDASKDVIACTPRALLVFHRLCHLLNEQNPDLSVENIRRVLPEFDPSARDKIETCASNLKLLRNYVFPGKSTKDVTLILIHEVPRKKSEFGAINDYLNQDEHDIGLGVKPFLISCAEGGESDLARMNKKTGETYQSSKYTIATSSYWQNIVVSLYLEHPKINKTALTKEDFLLPREQFIERLVNLGLTTLKNDDRRFYTYLTEFTGKYCESAKEQNALLVDSARVKLAGLLREENNRFDPIKVSDVRAGQLITASACVDEALKALGNNITEVDKEIRRNLDDLLSSAGVRYCTYLEEKYTGAKLVLERTNSFGNYSLSYEKAGLEGNKLAIKTVDDYANKKAAFLTRSNNGRTSHFSGSTEQLNLQAGYSSLSKFQRHVFIGEVIDILSNLREAHDRDIVFVVPNDSPGETLFADLYRTILSSSDTQDWNVLGQADESLDFKDKPLYSSLKDSRIDFLTPELIPAYRKRINLKSYTLPNKLAYVYLALSDMREVILPGFEKLQEKIAKLNIDEFSETGRKAVSHLLQALDKRLSTNVIGVFNRRLISNVYNILELDSPNPITEQNLINAVRSQIVGLGEGITKSQFSLRDSLRRLGLNHFILINGTNEHTKHLVDETLLRRVDELSKRVVSGFLSDAHCLPNDLSVSEVEALNKELADCSLKLFEENKRLRQQKELEVHDSTVGVNGVQGEKAELPLTSVANKRPPFFNQDGKVIIWMAKGKRISKGLRGKPDTHEWVGHLDSKCTALKDATIEQTDTWGAGYKKFTMCKTCSKPFRVITDTIEKEPSKYEKLTDEEINEINISVGAKKIE